MNPDRDPVDAALELLRADDHLELPPPFRPRAPRAARRSRLLPTLAVVLGLSAAAAATGGLETLRTWWYSITVDGQRVEGFARGDGERTAEFVTADGCRVTVRVVSTDEGRRKRTGIQVTQEGPGRRLEQDVETTLVEPLDEREAGGAPTEEGLSRRALVGGDKLHEWIDPGGVRWALYVTDDPEASGSRLLLHEVESDGPRPVALLGRTASPLAEGAQAEVTEHADGEVRVVIDDGRGAVFELMVASGRDGPPTTRPATEYVSPDGQIRVRVDD